MPDYYAQLGLNTNATREDIKTAYKRLAMEYHPDRVLGKEQEFQQVQEAYEYLMGSEQQRTYDESFNNLKGFVDVYSKKKLRFYLPENPQQYDHYNYVNELFQLEGIQRLIPGEEIKNKDILWGHIHYVGTLIYREKKALLSKTPKPQGEIKERINKITTNEAKLAAVSAVLCSIERRKPLYDLSLGVDDSDEMREIAHLIGGVEGLIQHIRDNPLIHSVRGIFSLYEAKLLNPENFNQLVQCGKDILDVAMILDKLQKAKILTQANFDLVIKNKQYATAITGGIGRLNLVKVFNQKYFEILVSTGKSAKSVGSTLEGLQLIGVLNDENTQMVINKIPDTDIWDPLYAMQQEGILTNELTDTLHWTGPEEMTEINHNIDKMVAHALFLLSCDIEKGKVALLLALELKKDLKEFFEKHDHEDYQSRENFKTSFIKKLHSEDKQMTTHRDYWKVLVANILIAFTGLGLFAIGIQYAMNGRCFFAQTTREQMIETIEHSKWLASPEAVASSANTTSGV